MFSDKMEYYGKPCKWLYCLLNLIFPLMVIASIYDIVSMAVGLQAFAPIKFVQNIIFAVAFIAIDLLARFLDKIGFVSLVVGHGIAVISDSVSFVVTLILMGDTANDLISNGISGEIVSTASRLATIGELVTTIISLVVYAVSLIYVFSRQDLFLTPEGKMRPPQN